MATVALVGTLDTKGRDFAFLAARLRAAGAEVIVIDAGTGAPDGLIPDVDGEVVAAAAGTSRAELRAASDRGRAVTDMGRGAAVVVADLVARGRVGGVLGAGGSGGSSIAAQVMAVLPVGLQCSDHPEWVLPTNWTVAPDRPVLEVVLSTAEGIEIRPYTGGFIGMTGDGTAGHPDWPHIGVALMQPRARGRITLVSGDPGVPPRIEHHYDGEPDDVAALRRGSELARELAGTATHVGSPVWSTSQHLCASAPMGIDRDPRAVVDPRCRVRGIENLWVIDGSILPAITSRGPHATIVMLGHRAAEFVQ